MTSTHPTLVLLHGLGATGQVWDPLVKAAAWSGRVLAPDLPGHGSSNWADTYSFGSMATEVAACLESDEEYVVLGHSMGGAVGGALATGFFGHPPTAVGMVGVKLVWTEEELLRLPAVAAKPSRLFENRDGAAEWFLKLSGLFGVLELTSPIVERGICETSGGWQVCQDPKSVLVVEGSPPFADVLRGLLAPVFMAIGEHDPLVSAEDHADMPTGVPHVFEGLGHNAMVENPSVVWDWFARVVGLN